MLLASLPTLLLAGQLAAPLSLVVDFDRAGKNSSEGLGGGGGGLTTLGGAALLDSGDGGEDTRTQYPHSGVALSGKAVGIVYAHAELEKTDHLRTNVDDTKPCTPDRRRHRLTPAESRSSTIMHTWTTGLQSMWESSGLVLRSHECTLLWSGRKRSSSAVTRTSLNNCLANELKRKNAPASIWRADLPQAFFAHSNATVGVGWVLNLSTISVSAVNAHDSYSKLTRRCEAGLYSRYANATRYADTRIAYILKDCKRGRTFPAEYNCLTNMDAALRAQREFWRRSGELGHCQRSPSLHNEALATYTTKDILGVFLDLRFNLSKEESRTYAELAARAAGGVPIFGLPLRFRLPNGSAQKVKYQLDKSAKSCLLGQTPGQTHSYLAKLYGSQNVRPAASTWRWPSVDVIWTDKLDQSVADCLLHHRTPGVWTVHEATGFYAPPIGSKMEHPVVWQYRQELACEGQTAEHGGERSMPTESNGSWIEVFRYQWLDTHESMNDDTTWMYRSRGSGVWYWTGRTLLCHDTVDLQHYISRRFSKDISASGKSKRQLIDVATQLLKPEFQTIIFSQHIDGGFQHNYRCSGPKPGWAANYFSLYEVVAIRKVPTTKEGSFTVCHRDNRCASLGVRLKAGWFDDTRADQGNWSWPCVQDPSTLQNASRGKWHHHTVRCLI